MASLGGHSSDAAATSEKEANATKHKSWGFCSMTHSTAEVQARL